MYFMLHTIFFYNRNASTPKRCDSFAVVYRVCYNSHICVCNSTYGWSSSRVCNKKINKDFFCGQRMLVVWYFALMAKTDIIKLRTSLALPARTMYYTCTLIYCLILHIWALTERSYWRGTWIYMSWELLMFTIMVRSDIFCVQASKKL